MKESLNKIIEVDMNDFARDRITKIEQAMNKNSLNDYLLAMRDYCKLEELMETNGCKTQIHNARKRIHELMAYCSFDKMKLDC